MPERPDLEYQIPILREALVGRVVAEARVPDPVLLRVLIPGDARAALAGSTVRDVARRAHFVVIDLGPDLALAIHPMLAGRFTICPAATKQTKDTGFVLRFTDDLEMRFRDDKQMGKVYVYPPAARDEVPGLGAVGVDVLGPEFSLERLRALAKGRREQIKVFLMDKTTLDAFGNAYADEALWAARIHPKARVNELNAEALERLHGAMIAVLREARDEVAARRPPLDAKVRDFLVVRNRKGAPCPRCGAPVRVLGVHGHDAFFCAVCQPDDKGRGLVDWRRT